MVIFNIVGSINNPLESSYGGFDAGPVLLFTNIIRLVFLIAGVYSLMNFIIAGYQYMSAAGDTKYLEKAWGRIWQTLLGLVIIVGSFVITSIVSQIIFGRWDYILNPQICGPGECQ
jgi:hypothetical protein